MSVSSGGALYVTTNAGLYHAPADATTEWVRIDSVPDFVISLLAVEEEVLYAIGVKPGLLFRWSTGLGWTTTDLRAMLVGADRQPDLFGVWGTSDTDVYVVGLDATIVHIVAGVPVLESNPLEDITPGLFLRTAITGIGGTSNAVFASSGTDVLRKMPGSTWTIVQTPPSGGLGTPCGFDFIVGLADLAVFGGGQPCVHILRRGEWTRLELEAGQLSGPLMLGHAQPGDLALLWTVTGDVLAITQDSFDSIHIAVAELGGAAIVGGHLYFVGVSEDLSGTTVARLRLRQERD